MNYRVFQYPLPAPEELPELNGFLASNRIATVSHHLATTPDGAMLVFVVQTAGPAAPAGTLRNTARTDFRELLSPAAFVVFDRLRKARKEWAEAEAVPVYTIFSNAQLADMVQRSVRSTGDLAKVEGVGPARIEKYGERLLAVVLAGQSADAATQTKEDAE